MDKRIGYTDENNQSEGSTGQQVYSNANLAFGGEYRSKLNIFGLPLVHIAYGVDLKTGKLRVAKGIIAIGNIAIGLLAIGGLSIGGFTVGGLALGIIALAGMSFGALVAVGGLAVSIYLAAGGMAIAGEIALGGIAISLNYAFGGLAIAKHPYGGNYQDPAALEFLRSLLGDLKW